MMRFDKHPGEDILLQRIDGELPDARGRQIDLHLANCADCRKRSESLAQTLEAASLALHQEHGRAIADPPGGFRDFRRQLASLEEKHGRASSATSSRVLHWTAVAAVAAACALLAIFLYPSRRLTVVSAREILDQATARYRAERTAYVRPVARQKVRIRLGSQQFTRTIYRDLVNLRQADLADEARPGRKRKVPPASEVVQRRFAALAMNWNDPLSPEYFSIWYRGHADSSRDRVAKAGTETVITAAAASGAIRSATFHLRTSDYHPTAELLVLDDSQQLEITELEYRVAPFDQIAQGVFPLAVAPAADSKAAQAPSFTDAEIRALSALHSLSADLDEEIAVKHGPDGTVEITGLVTTADRKLQIEHALAAIPGLVTHLSTIGDAARREPATSRPPARAERPAASAESGSEILSERIPDSLQREAFLGKAFDSSQKLLSRAFALKRLSERYPPDEEGRLSDEGRRTLRNIISDHVWAMQQIAAALGEQFAGVFNASPPADTDDLQSVSWQAAAPGLLSIAQKVDADMTSLFTKPRDDDPKELSHRPAALVLDVNRIGQVLGRLKKGLGG